MAANEQHDSRVHLIALLPSLIHGLQVPLVVAGHDRFEFVVPTVRRVDVARAQRTALQITELD